MKVSFFDVAAPEDVIICVRDVHAVPRHGELVVIDDVTWLVGTVSHVMVADDEPVIHVLLRSPD